MMLMEIHDIKNKKIPMKYHYLKKLLVRRPTTAKRSFFIWLSSIILQP
jgi:hypothetical protein